MHTKALAQWEMWNHSSDQMSSARAVSRNNSQRGRSMGGVWGILWLHKLLFIGKVYARQCSPDIMICTTGYGGHGLTRNCG